MSAREESRTSGGHLLGYLAEFETVDGLYLACQQVRDQGYRRWDAHAPFPVHGLDDAMGIRATKLPWLVFFAGAAGGGLGLLLQWWTNAVDYPVIISGKPMFSIPANIPITFETTVLLAALSAFIGMLAFNGLPRYHHPVFRSKRFRRATTDRFFISIDAKDPKFSATDTRKFLDSLQGARVESLEE